MSQETIGTFKAKADDNSIWEISGDQVVADMIAHEKKEREAGYDDPWSRPITRSMALQWISDNADSIEGWALVSSEIPSPAGLLVVDKD